MRERLSWSSKLLTICVSILTLTTVLTMSVGAEEEDLLLLPAGTYHFNDIVVQAPYGNGVWGRQFSRGNFYFKTNQNYSYLTFCSNDERCRDNQNTYFMYIDGKAKNNGVTFTVSNPSGFIFSGNEAQWLRNNIAELQPTEPTYYPPVDPQIARVYYPNSGTYQNYITWTNSEDMLDQGIDPILVEYFYRQTEEEDWEPYITEEYMMLTNSGFNAVEGFYKMRYIYSGTEEDPYKYSVFVDINDGEFVNPPVIPPDWTTEPTPEGGLDIEIPTPSPLINPFPALWRMRRGTMIASAITVILSMAVLSYVLYGKK